MIDIVIVDAVRTPLGKRNGWRAPDDGANQCAGNR